MRKALPRIEIKKAYKNFIESNKAYSKLSYKEYSLLLDASLRDFSEAMMTTKDCIEMPSGLGYVYPFKYVPTRQHIDLIHLCKTGERRLMDNSHTDGFSAKYMYISGKGKSYPRLKYYNFVPCRTVKRGFSKEFKKAFNDYPTLEKDESPVLALFESNKKPANLDYEIQFKGISKELNDKYNEFDL